MATPMLTPVLNGNTRFAWLPGELSSSYNAFQIVVAVTFGLVLWECVVHAKHDWAVARELRSVGILKVALNGRFFYLSTRFWTLLTMVLAMAFFTATHANCQGIWLSYAITNALSMISISAFLGLRVTAVWQRKRAVMAVMLVLWIIDVGAILTIVKANTGSSISNLAPGIPAHLGCAILDIKSYSPAAYYATLGFDLVCLFLIVVACAIAGRKQDWAGTNVRASPMLAVFQRQTLIYYLVSFLSSVAVTVLLVNKHIDGLRAAIYTNPNMALQALLISWLFRGLRESRKSKPGSSPAQRGGEYLLPVRASPGSTLNGSPHMGYGPSFQVASNMSASSSSDLKQPPFARLSSKV